MPTPESKANRGPELPPGYHSDGDYWFPGDKTKPSVLRWSAIDHAWVITWRKATLEQARDDRDRQKLAMHATTYGATPAQLRQIMQSDDIPDMSMTVEGLPTSAEAWLSQKKFKSGGLLTEDEKRLLERSAQVRKSMATPKPEPKKNEVVDPETDDLDLPEVTDV